MTQSGQCRCPQCFGLREYMLQLNGKDYGLPGARGHGPELVELGPQCDASMTCACPACVRERGRRRPVEVRQPWDIAA